MEGWDYEFGISRTFLFGSRSNASVLHSWPVYEGEVMGGCYRISTTFHLSVVSEFSSEIQLGNQHGFFEIK
jgi:hypothetical protein